MKKRITKTLDFIQSEAITDNKPKKAYFVTESIKYM